MSRVYNFAAGPSTLPFELVLRAQKEFAEYKDTGMSVMETSHRTFEFDGIIFEAERLIRKLLNVPENYDVLFLQGGGTLQFSMVPLNLKKNGLADYVNTGKWANYALQEAKKFLKVNEIASSADKEFTYIPTVTRDMIDADADYVYVCDNNTVFGTKFHGPLDTGDVPLVADMSSSIMSEPIEVSRYGLIFATAQKNMGCTGVTIVIVRKDLVHEPAPDLPIYLGYKLHADNGSMYNTPPTFSIYINMLLMQWIEENGGLAEMKRRRDVKAEIFNDCIEHSTLFYCPVPMKDRSPINIRFTSGREELDRLFVEEAKAAGFANLSAHTSTGGMRASIYNAMPQEGVEKLADFIRQFEKKHQ